MAGEQTPGPASQAPPEAAGHPEINNTRVIDDPILSALAEDLKLTIAAEQPIDKPVPAPEIKPVPEEKPPEAPAAPAARVTVKPREDARKIAEEVVTERFKRMEQEGRPVLPPKPETPKLETEAPEDLDEDERDEMQDAQFASKTVPELKDLPRQLKEWKPKLEAWVKEQSSDPDRTFDENDAAFVEFVSKTKPSWKGHRTRVHERRVATETSQETMQAKDVEYQDRIEKAERTAKEAQMQPSIEKDIQVVSAKVVPDKDADDPLVQEIYREASTQASTLANDYLRLIHGIDKFASPEKNPDLYQRQAWVLNFIHTQGQIFEERGGDAKVRDGKTFIPLAKWNEMVSSGKSVSNHWTLQKDDVLKMLSIQAINEANVRIAKEIERATKLGFVKTKPTPAPKTAQQPSQPNAPKVTASMAPGAAQVAEGTAVNEFGRELLETLELKIR